MKTKIMIIFVSLGMVLHADGMAKKPRFGAPNTIPNEWVLKFEKNLWNDSKMLQTFLKRKGEVWQEEKLRDLQVCKSMISKNTYVMKRRQKWEFAYLDLLTCKTACRAVFYDDQCATLWHIKYHLVVFLFV